MSRYCLQGLVLACECTLRGLETLISQNGLFHDRIIKGHCHLVKPVEKLELYSGNARDVLDAVSVCSYRVN